MSDDDEQARDRDGDKLFDVSRVPTCSECGQQIVDGAGHRPGCSKG